MSNKRGLWDLPRVKGKRGAGTASKEVDEIVYGITDDGPKD